MIQPFNPQLNQQVQQFVQAEQMNRPGPRQGMMPQDRRFAEQAQDDQFTTNMAQIASTERTWGKKNELDYMAHQERLGENRRQFDEVNRIREEDKKLLNERSRRLAEGRAEILRRQIDRVTTRQGLARQHTEDIESMRVEQRNIERGITKAVLNAGKDRNAAMNALGSRTQVLEAQRRFYDENNKPFFAGFVGGITADLAGPQVSDTAPITEMFVDPENMPAGGEALPEFMGYNQVVQRAKNDPNFARTGVSDTGRVNKSVASRMIGTLKEFSNANVPDVVVEDVRQILDGMASGNLDEQTTQARIASVTGALQQAGISPVQFMAILEQGQQGLVENIGQAVDQLDLGGESLGTSIYGEDGGLQAISLQNILGDDYEEALQSEASLNSKIAQMPIGFKNITEGIARYFGAGSRRIDNFSENFGLLENINRQIYAANAMRDLADLFEAGGVPNQRSITDELAVLNEIEMDSRSSFEDAILGGNYSGAGDMEYSSPSLVDDVRSYMEANSITGDYDWISDLEAYESGYGDFRRGTSTDIRQLLALGDEMEDASIQSQRYRNNTGEIGALQDQLTEIESLIRAYPQ